MSDDESTTSRPRSRWRNPRFVVPLAIGIVVLSLLGYWAFLVISPLVECGLAGSPSGTSGTECYQGTEFYFTTVSITSVGNGTPIESHGYSFSFSSVGNSPSRPSSVLANVTEPGVGTQELYLFASGHGSSGWVTSLSPDGNAGIQAHGNDLASVRLLVAVNPTPAGSGLPSPDSVTG